MYQTMYLSDSSQCNERYSGDQDSIHRTTSVASTIVLPDRLNQNVWKYTTELLMSWILTFNSLTRRHPHAHTHKHLQTTFWPTIYHLSFTVTKTDCNKNLCYSSTTGAFQSAWYRTFILIILLGNNNLLISNNYVKDRLDARSKYRFESQRRQRTLYGLKVGGVNNFKDTPLFIFKRNHTPHI